MFKDEGLSKTRLKFVSYIPSLLRLAWFTMWRTLLLEIFCAFPSFVLVG